MLDRATAMRQKMLSAEDESELLTRWRDTGDMEVREKIIRSHMRICYSLASKWTKNESHINDLAQEGVFGLIHAMDKFDPSRNIRFGTYAKWWIKTSIEDKLSKISLSIDMPSRVYRKAKASEPAPGTEDLVPWEARVIARGEIPLDAPMGDNGEDTLIDMISDHQPNPEENSMESNRLNEIKRLIDTALNKAMTPREAEIIRRRSLTDSPETLEVIAESMGISRERVRQIQGNALLKLKRHMIETKFPISMLYSVFSN